MIAIAAVAASASAVAATVITSRPIRDGTIQLVDISPQAKKALRSAVGPAAPRGAGGVAGPVGTRGRSASGGSTPARRCAASGASGGDTTHPSYTFTGVTFPIPAPGPVDSAHVVVAGNDSVAGDGCSGTPAAPVAARGFVCVYFANGLGTTGAGGYGGLTTYDSNATGDGSRYGFVLYAAGGAAWAANGPRAYTAP